MSYSLQLPTIEFLILVIAVAGLIPCSLPENFTGLVAGSPLLMHLLGSAGRSQLR